MKLAQLNSIVMQMRYRSLLADKYLIKYGAEGDDFYVILSGEVSVWVPVSMKDVVQPLKQFKKAINVAITAKNHSTEQLIDKNSNVRFRFHMDP